MSQLVFPQTQRAATKLQRVRGERRQLMTFLSRPLGANARLNAAEAIRPCSPAAQAAPLLTTASRSLSINQEPSGLSVRKPQVCRFVVPPIKPGGVGK